jgi:hypothetical protein
MSSRDIPNSVRIGSGERSETHPVSTRRGTHLRDGAARSHPYTKSVIYCVIPPELADELYDKMVEYYKDNPNVTVIIDRRTGPDRRQDEDSEQADQRETRDRRRPRIPGTFPDIVEG